VFHASSDCLHLLWLCNLRFRGVIRTEFSDRCGIGYSLPEWTARTKGAFCVWGNQSELCGVRVRL